MTFLPVVVRELREAARQKATYRNRLAVAGVIFFFAVIAIFFDAASGSRAFGPLRGKPIFVMLSNVAFLFCMLEPFSKTVDALSSEKREGTIGLLFLTDLKGFDIVLGKLAATSLQSFYGLLGVMPMLGLPLLMGGVTAVEFWKVMFALLNSLFFALAVGIFVSSFCRERRTANRIAFSILLAINIVPMWFQISAVQQFSPAILLNGIFTRLWFTPQADYVTSMGIIALMGIFALAGASIALPRCWQEGGARSLGRRTARETSPELRAKRSQTRHEQLSRNPILWLAGRQTSRGPWTWLFSALIVVTAGLGIATGSFRGGRFLPPGALGFLLLNLLLLERLASQAPRFFVEARRTGALELLFTTPLKTEDILLGQRLALQRTFTAPIAITLILEAMLAGIADSSGTALIIFLLFACYFILQAFAVINAGMWFGLICKNESAAAVRTVVFVLLLPMVCVPFCFFGAPFVIGIPIFWSAYASSKLRAELRSRATIPIG